MVVPATIDGKKVKKIYTTAFQDLKNLKTVKISEGIESIDMYTFSRCENLETVTFPNSINYISRYFYKVCPKIKYTIPSHLKEMEEGTYMDITTVTINGTKNYEKANQILPLVNEERAKKGLSPLSYSEELTEVAMKRAAETSIYWSHIRPCGMDCFTIASTFDGENIGAKTSSPTGIMTSWMNSALHRAAILKEEYKSIGIGCYQVNGVTFWVQTFSSDESTNTTQKQGTEDSTEKIDINTYSDKIVLNIYGLTERENLQIGETKSPTKVALTNTTQTDIKTPIELSDITWTSSNENIFTVNRLGTITAINPGTATLTAKLGNQSLTCAINIIAEDVTMSLDKHKCRLERVADTIQLNANLSTGSVSKATWTSNNTKVATVDSNGLVTAKGGGFATITAQNEFGIDKCKIYVCALRTLEDGSKAYPGDLDRNGVINAVDEAMIQDWVNRNLTEDEIQLADLNQDGIVNAIDAGMFNILYDSFYEPGTYTTIQSISLNKREINLEIGETTTLTATVLPTNHTDSPKIIWKTSNSKIATVDSNGKVTAIGGGTANITAIADNGSGKQTTCQVTVKEDKMVEDVLALVPSTMALNLKEIEFEKVFDEIEKKVEKLLENSDFKDSILLMDEENTNVQNGEIKYYITVGEPIDEEENLIYGPQNIKHFRIEIIKIEGKELNNTNYETIGYKDFVVKYSNSDDYNTADEQYVKSYANKIDENLIYIEKNKYTGYMDENFIGRVLNTILTDNNVKYVYYMFGERRRSKWQSLVSKLWSSYLFI